MQDVGKEIAAARDFSQLAALMPILEAELTRLAVQVTSRMAGKVRDGTLTPDEAVAAWHELTALAGIERHFRSRIASGRAGLSKS